jgi:hypothetical protein
MMNPEERFYKLEQETIRWVVDHNEFQIFLTLRDSRPKDSYRKFRRTDQFGDGYRYRQQVTKKIINCFKRVYGIKGKVDGHSELFFYALHESGCDKKKKTVHKDAGHIHCLIGFKPHSKFYDHPDKRIKDFENYLKGKTVDCLQRKDGSSFKTSGELKWINLCTSLKNEDLIHVIKDKYALSDYVAKEESGTISHSRFSKQPFFGGDIKLPNRFDLSDTLLDAV